MVLEEALVDRGEDSVAGEHHPALDVHPHACDAAGQLAPVPFLVDFGVVARAWRDAVLLLIWWVIRDQDRPHRGELEATFAKRTCKKFLVRSKPVVDTPPAEQMSTGCNDRFLCHFHADVALILLLHLVCGY